MSASITRLPPREDIAVLTCPTPDEWHVTTYKAGTGEVLKHYVYYNAYRACSLVGVLERNWGHRIVLSPEAERWRHLLYCLWSKGDAA